MSRPKPNVILEHINNKPKYKKTSFSNPGHAHNLAQKLNETFHCKDFKVVKMTSGEVVDEE